MIERSLPAFFDLRDGSSVGLKGACGIRGDSGFVVGVNGFSVAEQGTGLFDCRENHSLGKDSSCAIVPILVAVSILLTSVRILSMATLTCR